MPRAGTETSYGVNGKLLSGLRTLEAEVFRVWEADRPKDTRIPRLTFSPALPSWDRQVAHRHWRHRACC